MLKHVVHRCKFKFLTLKIISLRFENQFFDKYADAGTDVFS